jgi:hypothetical protein
VKPSAFDWVGVAGCVAVLVGLGLWSVPLALVVGGSGAVYASMLGAKWESSRR